MRDSAVSGRMAVVQRGQRLEYFTIGWDAIEGGVAVAAGAIAGSIAPVGFGLDSFIEVTSGLTLLWRMSVDADVHRRELNEKRAIRIVGACFLLLAAYVALRIYLGLVVPEDEATNESIRVIEELQPLICETERLRQQEPSEETAEPSEEMVGSGN
jgi:hypothetical protein